MKLALSAKITCDPKHIRESRWAHDTAHVLLHSVLEARREASQRGKSRKN